MALRKVKLGELIELVDERNSTGSRDFRGLNINKRFMPTAANTDGLDETKYKVIRKGRFAFSGMQTGRDVCIRIGLSTESDSFIVSPAYQTFEVSAVDEILPEYLFMLFNSNEKDRLGWFLSDGSVRANLDWGVFCDTDILLPPIEVQRKYVAVYEAMLENQRSYERGLDDLKLTCDGYIEKLMHGYRRTKLAGYLYRHDCRNKDNSIKNVKGVSTAKEFREPTAKVDRNNLGNYKIVRPGWFSCVQTTHNEKCFAFAMNDTDKDIVVTSVNEVFSVNSDELVPEYLAAFFRRREFDRYARFHSWGSARETFSWVDLQDVEIPIPDIKTQRAIADIYKVYRQRSEINERLKTQLKDICPILIKGSIDEARAS